jgi:hypothetical protein
MARTRRPRHPNKDIEAAILMNRTRSKTELKTYDFTLVFAGEFEDLSQELVDAVYDAGCDDSLISLSECVRRISFSREAPSYRIALISAIADIERPGLGLELAAVEGA